jgi:hypothetical protein
MTGHMYAAHLYLHLSVSAQRSNYHLKCLFPPAGVRGLIALRILCPCHMSVQRSNYHSNVLPDFCPRVYCHLHRNAMLKRASDWTYAGKSQPSASVKCHTHALEQRDYDTRPPAPQEQSLLSRVADTLRTFCPRVFSINHHFSQESALQRAQIRAPDWTYTLPRPPRHSVREFSA